MAANFRRTVRRLVLKNFVPSISAPKVVAPKGVVLLNQPPIADKTPHVSNFAQKLETYLRVTQIPYLNKFTFKLSSKSKIPWIEYNGQKIADSNFCIRFLNEEFNVELDKNLTASEKAVAHAVLTTVEENLYWSMVYIRWIENAPATMKLIAPNMHPWIRNMMTKGGQKQVRINLRGHGIGRHKRDEILSIAHRDLCAVSDILSDKPYVMGDEPTLVDCTVFGLVAQFLWQDVDSPQHKVLTHELKNLVTFCERMKERFWSDWDEEIAKRKQYQGR